MKYYFTAVFKDGTVYTQNTEDKSERLPHASCFRDIMEDLDKIVLFGLHDLNGREYGVDLRDGTFDVNGLTFRMHEDPVKNVKLIYHRRHTHAFAEDGKESGHTIAFRFGWRDEETGVERVMEIY